MIARSSAAESPVTHHGSVCTSNSTVVVRRRTRVTAWETTAASSTGSTDGVAGSSRASSTRSPMRVVISLIWARTSSISSLREATESLADVSAWASRSRLVRREVSGVRSS